MSDDPDLVPVFTPALGAVLLAAEDRKGEPLDPNEVLVIRDNAVCIMMEPADAEKMLESRGYSDIDPENCWYDWQMLRRELGRKPDLDPGARVDFIDSNEPEYQATIQLAQDSLHAFRDLIAESSKDAPLVKTELPSSTEGKCFVWLHNVKCTEVGFTAELFEIPPALEGCTVGDRFEIKNENVLDWMVNDQGTLHGGFSIRYLRERMSEKERADLDKHIGVERYA